MSSQKPQLHQSDLAQFAKCQIQWQRRRGYAFGVWHETEIRPPGIAANIGTSVHLAVEKNLTAKMEIGQLLPRAEIKQIARDSILKLWDTGQIALTREENLFPARVQGEAVDLSVALAALHYDKVAPDVQPVAIEEKFVVILPDMPFDLAGQMDMREIRDGQTILVDVKTSNKTPGALAARGIQMPFYSMAEEIERKLPDKVRMDFLVKNKVVAYVPVPDVPDRGCIDRVKNRIQIFAEIIEDVKQGKRGLAPADPDSFICTRTWCGYAETCPFFSGRD